jgi:hypothetical protein
MHPECVMEGEQPCPLGLWCCWVLESVTAGLCNKLSAALQGFFPSECDTSVMAVSPARPPPHTPLGPLPPFSPPAGFMPRKYDPQEPTTYSRLVTCLQRLPVVPTHKVV